MYSSAKKLPSVNENIQHHSVLSKKHRSVSKNAQSNSKSGSPQNDKFERQVRKQMTSNAYNNVFNRLIKVTDLKQFVKQSSQYVEFHQQQVQKYIPAGQNDKKRFSFSLKNSIFSFLTRDYRFLKHYFTLLQNQFPEKADKLRQQIFNQYKELVIDRKKFEYIFAPDSFPKSQRKSEFKNNKSLSSAKKKNNKSQNKIKLHSQLKLQDFDSKSHQTSKKTLNQNLIDQTSKFKKQIVSVNKNFIKRNQNALSRNKNLSKTKNTIKNQIQNKDPNAENSSQFSKRRTTMQNIKIIEQTLYEIQTIFSNSNTQKSQKMVTRSKSKLQNKPQSSRFLSKSKNIKAKPQPQQEKLQYVEQTQFQREIQIVNREDETLQKLFAMRSNNKSKKKNHQNQDQDQVQLNQKLAKSKKSRIKSSVKKQRKTVTFDELFDINDPQNRNLIETVESMRKQRQIKRQTQLEKDKNANKILQKLRLSISLNNKNKCWRVFNKNQRDLLTEEQRQIIENFKGLDFIGDWKDFFIDRKCALSGVLGQVNEYKIEYVLVWPLKGEQQDVFKALYLTKLHEKTQKESLKNLSFEELKDQITEIPLTTLNLLLIEK